MLGMMLIEKDEQDIDNSQQKSFEEEQLLEKDMKTSSTKNIE